MLVHRDGKMVGLAKVAGEEHPDALNQAGKLDEEPAEVLGEDPSERAVFDGGA